jgi:hypothetical protein
MDKNRIDMITKALLSYSQADTEGLMVNVSRQACDEAAEQLKQMRDDLEFLSQWVVDMDEGKFMDANDLDYLNGVDEAKAHLRDLAP